MSLKYEITKMFDGLSGYDFCGSKWKRNPKYRVSDFYSDYAKDQEFRSGEKLKELIFDE